MICPTCGGCGSGVKPGTMCRACDGEGWMVVMSPKKYKKLIEQRRL